MAIIKNVWTGISKNETPSNHAIATLPVGRRIKCSESAALKSIEDCSLHFRTIVQSSCLQKQGMYLSHISGSEVTISSGFGSNRRNAIGVLILCCALCGR